MAVRKQSLSHDDFRALRERARSIPRAAVDAKIETAIKLIRRFVIGRDLRAAAYAWSGGKDSIALRFVAEAAGVKDCLLGISNLEYPAFLRWVTDHMPPRLSVINTGQDLEWLARHPEMLFPATADLAAKWFKSVQHTAQARYYRENRLDVILLGRRRDDGNYVGPGPDPIYTSQEGVTRLSPLADWTHEDVFAVIDTYGLAMPPFYGWPRGYRCGTHAWAARQWCGTIRRGWGEVHGIDPSIVLHAARRIPSAAEYLESL